jgi:N-methylhydantoinase A/oxoprolinase/acetone carboxylase beta subunit
VTDANVLLGRVTELAGDVQLTPDRAAASIAGLAHQLGLEPRACAAGIIRVANAEMVRALRVVTVERGIDPRGYALLAFGGAGPLHAAEIADELGIETVLCPRAAGVLAALGLVVSPRRRDAQRTVMLAADDPAVASVVAELGALARKALGEPEADLTPAYELRYRGQAFELPIRAEIDGLREAFEATHEERYGYRDPDGVLELVTVRVTATVAGAEVELESAAEPEPVEGPVVRLPGSTVYVPEGWSASVDPHGTVWLRR